MPKNEPYCRREWATHTFTHKICYMQTREARRYKYIICINKNNSYSSNNSIRRETTATTMV